jgi:hypothetical protein
LSHLQNDLSVVQIQGFDYENRLVYEAPDALVPQDDR